MEKVTLFFCDIYGTFDNGNKFKVDDFQIKRFIENLNKIIINKGIYNNIDLKLENIIYYQNHFYLM